MSRDCQLEERQRRRRFALVAVLLLGLAVALTLAERPEPPGVALTTTATVPSLAAPLPSVTVPDPVPTARPARPPARELRRAARRFLRGYLGHLYADRPARRIEGAARALRRRLLVTDRRRSGRRPAGRRAPRAGRVVALAVGGFVPDARAWRVRARIADGRNVPYPLELLVADRDGRLVVVATGSAG